MSQKEIDVMSINKLLKKPKRVQNLNPEGKYHRFFLKENPFPVSPVDKNSTDRRINGEIYEDEIRAIEYAQIEDAFLKQPQSNLNRLRLGYICDTSYIGRGNGKSAFLVNLARKINKEYCLDITNGENKCFALYVTPEAGGRTKTFISFTELIFASILQSGFINVCLASLRLDAAKELYPEIDLTSDYEDEENFISNLNNTAWLREKGFDLKKLSQKIYENNFLQHLPANFPMIPTLSLFERVAVTENDFEIYFQSLKKGAEQINFIFSHLVQFFMASGFNGAYLLVDDFERIPDFQTTRQRKDFAIELRSCLLDGQYINSRYGFYNMLLVLHAGVPQLISEAWSTSGLGNRYPISPKTESKHLIKFEKLNINHVSMLLRKYLEIYRDGHVDNGLVPFTNEAIHLIAKNNDNNAAGILKTSYELLEKAAEISAQNLIDENFVKECGVKEHEYHDIHDDSPVSGEHETDLMKKASGQLT